MHDGLLPLLPAPLGGVRSAYGAFLSSVSLSLGASESSARAQVAAIAGQDLR